MVIFGIGSILSDGPLFFSSEETAMWLRMYRQSLVIFCVEVSMWGYSVVQQRRLRTFRMSLFWKKYLADAIIRNYYRNRVNSTKLIKNNFIPIKWQQPTVQCIKTDLPENLEMWVVCVLIQYRQSLKFISIRAMGNICADNAFSQIKELYPKDFQKLVEVQELEKHIESNFKQSQEKLNSSITAIEKEELSAIDFKKNQVKQHFEQVKKDVDRSYPGGISFLEKGKNAKVEDLFQYNLAEKQYHDIQEGVKTMIAGQKEKANSQLNQVRDEELKKLKDSKPVLQKFNALNQKVQADTLTQGLKQYKTQIEQKSKQLTEQINKKLGLQSILQKCRGFVPNDKLTTLTDKTKQNISKIAMDFVGHPSEGKATLY